MNSSKTYLNCYNDCYLNYLFLDWRLNWIGRNKEIEIAWALRTSYPVQTRASTTHLASLSISSRFSPPLSCSILSSSLFIFVSNVHLFWLDSSTRKHSTSIDHSRLYHQEFESSSQVQARILSLISQRASSLQLFLKDLSLS